MADQQPSVGRAVHVRLYADGKPTSDQCFAAVVARVWNAKTVNAGVFDGDGRPFSATSVVHDDGLAGTGYRWHWPERV